MVAIFEFRLSVLNLKKLEDVTTTLLERDSGRSAPCQDINVLSRLAIHVKLYSNHWNIIGRGPLKVPGLLRAFSVKRRVFESQARNWHLMLSLSPLGK